MRMSSEVYMNGLKNLQTAFTREKTWIYLIPMDTYGGQMSFGCMFKENVHPLDINKERVKAFEKAHNLNYYNFKVHNSAFSLPNYVQEALLVQPRQS